MAPEILRGEQYDEKSDIYSFGMILWELVTEKIPHNDLSPIQIKGMVGFDQSSEETPIPIPTRGIPLILRIMKDCLHKNREKRTSFEEIVHKLNAKNREKENQNNVINEIKWFFGL
eukprot:TRINITY_DN1390_c0_g2_i2.p3 TRINITY_DN1390_c0_g2~~TRINITY_DN1390_c0_g2_i2.p3  ORF type:complete len:116 (-),score=20.72 TRINITY_DN1390_c0_g2_i2:169-516(-)